MTTQNTNAVPTFEETLEWLQTTEYSGSIGVTALFRVKDQYYDRFIALLKDYIPYVVKEEGCLDFSFNRDWRNKNDIWLVEKWSSPKSLIFHLGPDARKGTKYEGNIPLIKFAQMEIKPEPAAIYKLGL